MTQASRFRSYWRTLPGVLTGLAAVITAVGGIMAILIQVGVLDGTQLNRGNAGGKPPAVAPKGPTRTTPGPTPTTAEATPTVAGARPWSDVEAVFTRKDGTRVTAPAETVRFCISAGTGIRFNDSQDIPFEKIRSIVIHQAPPHLQPDPKAEVRITLTGTAEPLTGMIEAGCEYFAFNDLGRISFYLEDLASIEFDH